jgi:hypothetical protein
MIVFIESSAGIARGVALGAAVALSLWAAPAGRAQTVAAAAQSPAPAVVVVKNSGRWHYERALIYAQENPAKGLAALYRTLENAEARRLDLERLVKAKLSPTERTELENFERVAKDRRLAGAPEQIAGRREFQKRLEAFARQKLSPAELAAWDALDLELRQIGGDLGFANKRPVRAIAALNRALKQADAAQTTLEKLIMSRLSLADRQKVNDVGRDLDNPNLAQTTAQRDARRTHRKQMELLARDHLSVTEYGVWKSLKRERLETHYLLGHLHFHNQRAGDAILALERIFDFEEAGAATLPSRRLTTPEKLAELEFSVDDAYEYAPARLLLARAYEQLHASDKAAAQAVILAQTLKLNDAQTKVAMSHVSAYFGKPGKERKLAKAVETILLAADEALADPDTYQAATVARGLRDPLIYANLAQLVEDEADASDSDASETPAREAARIARTEEILTAEIAARDGFAPIAYLSLGELAERRAQAADAKRDASEAIKSYAAAIQYYETAVAQMKQLELTPESGDVDLTRLDDLRKKLAAAPNAR